MVNLEIHPGDGGGDAAHFADELAQAISRHTGAPVSTTGRVARLERL